MIRLAPILVIVALVGCSEPSTETTPDGHTIKRGYFENGELQAEFSFNKEGKKDGLCRSYYNNGRVRSDFLYKEGVKEGVSKNYYKEGGVSSEITYKDGKKNGPYIKYYKSGVKYTLSHYKNNQLDSTRVIYTRGGKPKSEMMYSGGRVVPGTKRFKPNGELRDPLTLRFSLDDKTALTGKAKLYIELSEKMPEVTYAFGVVNDEGKLKDNFKYPLQKDSKGRGYIEYTKSPYSMVMDKVEVVATAKDRDQQVYLVSGTYNLVLD